MPPDPKEGENTWQKESEKLQAALAALEKKIPSAETPKEVKELQTQMASTLTRLEALATAQPDSQAALQKMTALEALVESLKGQLAEALKSLPPKKVEAQGAPPEAETKTKRVWV